METSRLGELETTYLVIVPSEAINSTAAFTNEKKLPVSIPEAVNITVY